MHQGFHVLQGAGRDRVVEMGHVIESLTGAGALLIQEGQAVGAGAGALKNRQHACDFVLAERSLLLVDLVQRLLIFSAGVFQCVQDG